MILQASKNDLKNGLLGNFAKKKLSEANQKTRQNISNFHF